MTSLPPLNQAWDVASGRYADLDVPVARFNLDLLATLRPRWEQRVRPTTSMFTICFTRGDEPGYPDPTERVDVEMEREDRVKLTLWREVPRRGGERKVRPVVVAGDVTRPENVLPALEALLVQLAGGDL